MMIRKVLILFVSLLFAMTAGSVYASPGPEKCESGLAFCHAL